MAVILTIIHVSLESAYMTSEHFSFLLPAFESGFRCSRNGGPPVIWIISLYLWYQVYFVIIIMKFLVTVLSITYLKNIFWGWTVPLIFEEGHLVKVIWIILWVEPHVMESGDWVTSCHMNRYKLINNGSLLQLTSITCQTG